MKQRLLLILSLLLMVAMSQAAPVDANKAKDKALQFLSGKQAKARGMEQGTTPDVQLVTSEGDSYYVFNVGQQNGFVIVSGDDRAPEILGYSDSGTFDTQTIPENMRAWLQGYAEQIQLLDQVESPAAARAAISLRETPWTAIAPLIQTKWDQHEPYNNDVSPNVTGCVATAMAQVMYYHKWPLEATTAIPQYKKNYTDGTSKTFSSLPATTFDWNDMQKEYSGSESSSANAAVAKLMKYCGYSVEMNYGTGSSSAVTKKAVNALINYFKYDQNVRYIERSYYTIDEWETIIYEELRNNRPVMYGGSTVRGAGHEFICDGYDGNGMFHFNWGWGGQYNGFFVIWSTNPKGSGTGGSGTPDGYSSDQSAIIGIQKPTGQQLEEEKKLTVLEFFVYDNVLTYTRTSVNNNFTKVKLHAVVANGTASAFEPSMGFALYNGETRVETLWNANGPSCPSGNFFGKSINGNTTSYTTYSLPEFGSGRTGTFTIIPISKEKNSSTWLKDNMSDQRYIEATMTETTLTLRVMPPTTPNLEVLSVVYTGNSMAGIPQEVKATIRNNGPEFDGILYLTMNSNTGYSSAEQVALRAGEDTDVYFHYTPSNAGTDTWHIGTGTSSAKWLSGGTGTQPIIAYSATDNLDLNVSIAVQNKTNGNYIFGKEMNVIVTAANNTNEVYSGGIGINKVYSYYPIIILPGESYQQEFTIPMTVGNICSVQTWQIKGGYLHYNGNEISYTAAEGVEVTLPDGTTDIVRAQSTLNVPATVTSVDLRGVTSVNSVTGANTNCLFLVDENANTGELGTKNVITGNTAANIELTDNGNNGFVAPIDFTAEKISYQRTFTAGTDGNGSGWTTIVLPYDVEKVMVGNEEIDWFHSSSDTNGRFWLRELVSDGDLSVTFGYVDELKANTPYIIAVPGNNWGSQWSLVGKTLKFIGKSNASIIKDATAEEEGDYYRFTGTTTKQQLESVYALNDEGSSFTLGNATVDPFRAYFRAISSNSRAIDLQILSAGNQATAITLPDVEPLHTGEIYSIDGRMMGTSIESLPKGIYVVDGKKVVK